MSVTSELDDDDKVLYKKIGKTEIHIDKILANLFDDEVSFMIKIYSNTKLFATLSTMKTSAKKKNMEMTLTLCVRLPVLQLLKEKTCNK